MSRDIILDAFGRAVSRTETGMDDGDGTAKRVTEYGYDESGRCTREETKAYKADGSLLHPSVIKKDYGVQGKIVREESYTVGEENTEGVSITEYYYDEKGREIKRFAYNSLDSGSKYVTKHEYDEAGRETGTFGADGERLSEYEYYEGTKSVRSERAADGSVLSYGRDVNDNVTALTKSTEQGEENSTVTRYANGRIAEVRSGDTAIGYAYDGMGRVTEVTLNGGAYAACTYEDSIHNADG